ncbi:hypothetical protein PAN31117_05112 [Pandoraea anapnoica]|uniref:Pilin accessory protein (PilO) n=1 Tax=Pandoraea anapnoica TaxID=2508301 RepID=A0A5E5ASZ7_9BURK|nr:MULTISPECIES: type 4b pilus protein PilO2 [Pandoraea]VVE58381.1 hypothetical protein PIN31009_05288 [Pandoraea iniqua]VVE75220.1 hypothetical protein PAN31117_05112 [Pandoraea anapnoica]
MDEQQTQVPTSRTELFGKTVVAGLVWQPPDGGISRARARKEGLASGFGLMARHRVGHAIQIGYVSHESSLIGAYSLALLLANKLKHENWIGAFRLPDSRYALVGVLQGAIMAGRDVIGTRGEVESLLRSTVQLIQDAGQTLEAIFAPEEFETPWEERPLQDVLTKSDLKSGTRLKSLSGQISRKQLTLLFGVGAMIVVAAAGNWLWKMHKERIAEALQARSNQVVLVPPPNPWEKWPTADAQFAVWQQAAARVPYSIAGWPVAMIVLQEDRLTAGYVRKSGPSVQAFRAQALATIGVRPQVDAEGGRGEYVRDLSPPAGRGKETLEPSSALLLDWISYFQSLGISAPTLKPMSAEMPPPLPPSPKGEPKRQWAPADWETYGWEMETDIDPAMVIGLAPWPGVRVISVVIDTTNGAPHWKTKGVVYASKH